MKAQVISDENGQAVRIPEGLRLPASEQEVDVQAIPGGLLIRFEQRKLTGLAAKFAALGNMGVFRDGRPEQGDEEPRVWDTPNETMP